MVFSFAGIPVKARTGSCTPLPADNGSRVGCLVDTGNPPEDIPGFSVPDPGSWDRLRFVPEASKRCLLAWGRQLSPQPPALGYSSTRLVPQFCPRKQF